MSLDEIKRRLQDLFTDGLVTIVGSGLSCAEGLPSMSALAGHLKSEVPNHISEPDQTVWTSVMAMLDANLGLEAALHEVAVSSDLEAAIANATAEYILQEEGKVLAECLNTERVLRFSRLLRHLSPAGSMRPEVVTTNYDRLIEFAVESQSCGVDTGFLGRYWGRHAPAESDLSFAKGVVQHHKTPKLHYRDRVRLFKPHGSLDWYQTSQGPVSSQCH
jgi:hypothetical protein